MKKVIEKCKQIYNKETPLKVEWIMFGIIAFVMLISFYYIDLESLTIWSTNLLDCIADGDISQYYVYTSFNIYNLHHKFVSGPLFNVMFWAIWNIPIWIIQRFMGKLIINNAFLLLWSKLFLVVALGITLFFTYKICKELFKDNKKSLWIVYLAATFIFTYIGVFYAGQSDILICMFAIISLYFFIKKKNIWFYIFSSLAISIKYFYLLSYIPIILLTEKKIWKIFIKIGISILPVLIFILVFSGFPMYNQYAQNNPILEGIVGSGLIGINGANISFFILGFIIVCFMAYIIEPKTKEEKNNYVFYFSIIPMILMLMFSTSYQFYRAILLMPILMILYGFKPEWFRINVILDTIMSATALLFFSLNSKYIFSSTHSMNKTLVTKALKIKEVNAVSTFNWLREIFGDNIELVKNLSATIMFASLAIILVINYPKFSEKKEERENLEKTERWIIWIRALLIVPILAFLLVNIK